MCGVSVERDRSRERRSYVEDLGGAEHMTNGWAPQMCALVVPGWLEQSLMM